MNSIAAFFAALPVAKLPRWCISFFSLEFLRRKHEHRLGLSGIDAALRFALLAQDPAHDFKVCSDNRGLLCFEWAKPKSRSIMNLLVFRPHLDIPLYRLITYNVDYRCVSQEFVEQQRLAAVLWAQVAFGRCYCAGARHCRAEERQ